MRADHVVITAVPDIANLRNAKNLIDQIKPRAPTIAAFARAQPGRPRTSVPKSRSRFRRGRRLDPRIVIDFDAQLFGTAANNGQMIEEVSSKSKAAEAFRKLAALLTDRSEQNAERPSSLWSMLARLSVRSRAGSAERPRLQRLVSASAPSVHLAIAGSARVARHRPRPCRHRHNGQDRRRRCGTGWRRTWRRHWRTRRIGTARRCRNAPVCPSRWQRSA